MDVAVTVEDPPAGLAGRTPRADDPALAASLSVTDSAGPRRDAASLLSATLSADSTLPGAAGLVAGPSAATEARTLPSELSASLPLPAAPGSPKVEALALALQSAPSLNELMVASTSLPIAAAAAVASTQSAGALASVAAACPVPTAAPSNVPTGPAECDPSMMEDIAQLIEKLETDISELESVLFHGKCVRDDLHKKVSWSLAAVQRLTRPASPGPLPERYLSPSSSCSSSPVARRRVLASPTSSSSLSGSHVALAQRVKATATSQAVSTTRTSRRDGLSDQQTVCVPCVCPSCVPRACASWG